MSPTPGAITGAGSSIFTPRGSCCSLTVAFPAKGRLIFSVPTISPRFPRSTLDRSSSMDRYGGPMLSSTNSLETRTRPMPL
jgi:hypothetical protein